MEVFIRTVGSGGCDANNSALGRAISTGLQNGVPYGKFVKQFAKVNCISAIKNPSSEGHSCADVVGRCIELSAKNQSVATLNDWNIKKTGEQRLCPECRSPLDFGEGCNQGICKHCGWTGCSLISSLFIHPCCQKFCFFGIFALMPCKCRLQILKRPLPPKITFTEVTE